MTGKRYSAEIVIGSIILGVVVLGMLLSPGCADYGSVDSPITQPPPDAEPCPECEVCEICEICPDPEPCPECPKQDPCDCLDAGGEYAQQKCLSDMLREQGVCTQGHHFDVKIWCKEAGQWDDIKTWVYPCDEEPWHTR